MEPIKFIKPEFRLNYLMNTAPSIEHIDYDAIFRSREIKITADNFIRYGNKASSSAILSRIMYYNHIDELSPQEYASIIMHLYATDELPRVFRKLFIYMLDESATDLVASILDNIDLRIFTAAELRKWKLYELTKAAELVLNHIQRVDKKSYATTYMNIMIRQIDEEMNNLAKIKTILMSYSSLENFYTHNELQNFYTQVFTAASSHQVYNMIVFDELYSIVLKYVDPYTICNTLSYYNIIDKHTFKAYIHNWVKYRLESFFTKLGSIKFEYAKNVVAV